MTAPRGILVDYGGTLVEEVAIDVRAGNEWLLSHASHVPPHVTIDHVLERATRIARDVAGRRDHVHIETPWPTLTGLIHDYFGTRFDAPFADLELGFWKASMRTQAMPGAQAALERFQIANIPVGVVSNTSFSETVIRYELEKHGLAEHMMFVIVSSAYSVRKPSEFLFELAAARLGVQAKDIWFLGDRLDTDVAGAKASGMTAVWLNPSRRPDPSQSADLTVADWHEFEQHVLSGSPAPQSR